VALTSLDRNDLRSMLGLAGPVILAELGWIMMGIVDTIMVGRLGPEAIGAVGVGSSLFLALGVFGIGLLLGLDTLVSQAFGARQIDECHRWLHHGLALACLLAPILMLLAWVGVQTLDVWGFDPAVARLLKPYLSILIWSALPLLVYAALRRYLQAMSVVRPVMFALVSANIVNAGINWVLVYGNLGAPALGVSGSAWATLAARVYMAAVLVAAAVAHDVRHQTGLLRVAPMIDPARLWRLVRLGFPAAMQTVFEYGVFASATAFAGRLEPVALAAHQIVLNLAGFTFMVPFGLASAGAVRVGQAVGRRDRAAAARAGWTALALGVAFMAAAAVVFVLAPRVLLSAFTRDASVISTGVALLAIAAVFQMFDGMQGVLTGTLRGLGDTHTAMFWNLVGHWLFGLPLGYALCFWWGWGVRGLWMGLSAGLMSIGLILLAVWAVRTRPSPERRASSA
jgi:MATE family multidrug resistance protein